MKTSQFQNWLFDQYLDLVQDCVFVPHRIQVKCALNETSAKSLEKNHLFWSWFNRFDTHIGNIKPGDRISFMTLCQN